KAQLGELKTLETADSKARDQAHGKIDLTATKLAQLEQRHADAVKERAAIAKELGAIRTLLTTPAEKPSGEAQPAEAAAASTDK
ncbi:MAG: hypothetical protein H6834_14340, partial [Planctomycetes bacterium]|nr:hypothetical protein [Planctomycetota bacterium]